MNNIFAKCKNITEKKKLLKQLSAQAKKQIKSIRDNLMSSNKDFALPSVNQILISYYQDKDNKTFKSFFKWKKQGKKIKSGSKGYCVWGKPRKVTKKDESSEKENSSFDFFPIAYVFSNAQVE